MKVKIDTKEKMHVITIEEGKLAANMSEELQKTLQFYLEGPVNNVVVNFEYVSEIDAGAASVLVDIQRSFYDANHSMVFCQFQPGVEEWLDREELLETMNVTPTQSEAWDIVQMEEIERELL